MGFEEFAPVFAEKVKYLWRYPYINVSVVCDDTLPNVRSQLLNITDRLEEFTVSRNGLDASEQIKSRMAPKWNSQDTYLNQTLRQLPSNEQGLLCHVDTSPPLLEIFNNNDFTGMIEIIVQLSEGEAHRAYTPLREDIEDYIKEYASWCYLFTLSK